jgi:hypothetical protein
MATEILLAEVQKLRESGYEVELIEADKVVFLIFDGYPLPEGYNKQTTKMLLRLAAAYPNANPDMFWTEVDVLRADGTPPWKADVIEKYLERAWRRFSWHPQGWNPGTGNLAMYLEFVNTGLAKAGKMKA